MREGVTNPDPGGGKALQGSRDGSQPRGARRDGPEEGAKGQIRGSVGAQGAGPGQGGPLPYHPLHDDYLGPQSLADGENVHQAEAEHDEVQREDDAPRVQRGRDEPGSRAGRGACSGSAPQTCGPEPAPAQVWPLEALGASNGEAKDRASGTLSGRSRSPASAGQPGVGTSWGQGGSSWCLMETGCHSLPDTGGPIGRE